MTAPRSKRRVFISHAHDDVARAEVVRHALEASGVAVSELGASPGADVQQALADSIRTSDVVVVLLSAAASRSRWAVWEQRAASSTELDARGVAVIPVRLDPAEVPSDLARHPVIDLSADLGSGLRRLVEQVQATTLIDFSVLSPEGFERLVADLLTALGFDVELGWQRGQQGADMTARIERADPLGPTQYDTWLVECKLYSRERVSIQSIRQLVGLLASAPTGTRGLLVTSAQLTSVARQYLAELERAARVQVRVVDGQELVSLLRQHPAVVLAHFADRPGGPRADS